jgi:small subunit ribosomal protein S9
MISKKLIVNGKRKRAIAKATIVEGNGVVTINKIPYEKLSLFYKLQIQEPLDITKNILGKINFNISVNVKGGGHESQIEASRLAIAKAIYKFSISDELRNSFLKYDKNILVADTRRKESNKPGDSKARKKRQTSFR